MYQKLEADVAIIGGVLAGLNAAMAAAERGATAAIIEKGKIERSGCMGRGGDHFTAYLNEGEPWNTRDAYLAFVQEQSRAPLLIDYTHLPKEQLAHHIILGGKKKKDEDRRP